MRLITQTYLDELTYDVIGAAIEVHKTLGSGLLESVYQKCLEEELKYRNINFQSEKTISVIYRDKEMNVDFRCDFFIENCLVVELKSVNEMSSIFEAQLLTYMKLLKSPKGILINFNCYNIFSEGQKTYINEYFKTIPKM